MQSTKGTGEHRLLINYILNVASEKKGRNAKIKVSQGFQSTRKKENNRF